MTTGGERDEERARHVEMLYGTFAIVCPMGRAARIEMDGDMHWKLQCGDRLLGEAILVCRMVE